MKSLLDCKCGDKLVSFAPLILRFALGLIFVMHGWQKIERGIPGVSAMLGGLGFPMPEVFALVLVAAEFLGGIFLLLGLYTHWVAKILAFVALMAFITVHASKGFFVNTGGYEFIMLIFAAAVSLMITGPGKWSLDRTLRKK